MAAGLLPDDDDTHLGAAIGAEVLAGGHLCAIERYEGGAERRLRVAREQAAISREGLRVARDRVMVGAASPIDEQRAVHVDAISRALGRDIAITHRYAITMNGIATSLTPAEAARVAALPGVAAVREQRHFVTDTYRGPEFIGADSLWSGSATPNGLGTRGEGVVVGVIDTGSSIAHPSFANDATCGFGASTPKILSRVDCTTTDAAGVCNGDAPEADPGNGHGVHTASTAVGDRIDENVIPPPSLPPQHDAMSGVAPCASLRTYKVCPITGCTDAAITAGIENAIADRVDVINFSIGPNCGSVPGESPWSDGDAIWIDALAADIFVAASAGNTRAGCPDPVGKVSHMGPWLTTVAAATHDENVAGTGLMSATGPGAPSAICRRRGSR